MENYFRQFKVYTEETKENGEKAAIIFTLTDSKQYKNDERYGVNDSRHYKEYEYHHHFKAALNKARKMYNDFN